MKREEEEGDEDGAAAKYAHQLAEAIEAINRRSGPVIASRLNYRLEPTHTIQEHFSKEHGSFAQQLNAAKLTNSEGVHAAQAYLDKYLPNHKIDQDLSSKLGSVIQNTHNGDVNIAFRGTAPTGPVRTAAMDFGTNFAAIAGVGRITPQQREAEAIIKKAQNKYGDNRIKKFLGFSKGGYHALHAAQKFKKSSFTINPLYTREIHSGKFHSGTTHDLFRTTTDAPSNLNVGAFGQRQSNINVRTVEPLQGSTFLGLTDDHYLENFLPENHQAELTDAPFEEIDLGTREPPKSLKAKAAEEVKRLVKSGGLTAPNLILGLTGAYGGSQAFNSLDPNNTLPPELRALGEGTAAGVAGESLAASVIGRKFANPSRLGAAGAAGAIGYVTAEGVARGGEELLRRAGVKESFANPLARTAGGAVGGGVTLSAPAIAAQKAAGRGTLAVAQAAGRVAEPLVRPLATAAGELGSAAADSTAGILARGLGQRIASTAVGESVGEAFSALSAFEASTLIGAEGGPVGIAIGAILGGLIAGGFALKDALSEHNQYALNPIAYANTPLGQASHVIGQDPIIRKLIHHYNEEAHYGSEHEKNRLLRLIAGRIDELIQDGQIHETHGDIIKSNLSLHRIEGREKLKDYVLEASEQKPPPKVVQERPLPAVKVASTGHLYLSPTALRHGISSADRSAISALEREFSNYTSP